MAGDGLNASSSTPPDAASGAAPEGEPPPLRFHGEAIVAALVARGREEVGA